MKSKKRRMHIISQKMEILPFPDIKVGETVVFGHLVGAGMLHCPTNGPMVMYMDIIDDGRYYRYRLPEYNEPLRMDIMTHLGHTMQWHGFRDDSELIDGYQITIWRKRKHDYVIDYATAQEIEEGLNEDG